MQKYFASKLPGKVDGPSTGTRRWCTWQGLPRCKSMRPVFIVICEDEPQWSLAAIYCHFLHWEDRADRRWSICKRRARQDPALVNHPAHILRRFRSTSLGCRVPQRFHILFLVSLRRDHRQARPLLKLLHIPDNRKSDWAPKGQFQVLQDVHVWVHLQVGRMVKFKATKSFQE